MSWLGFGCMTKPRWVASVTYRTDTGPLIVPYDLVEIEDLHDIVERGPHWDTIHRIEIVRRPGGGRPLTLEEAKTL